MLKKKGPATRKPNGPKRKAEAKRRLDSKSASSKNQYLLLKFDKDNPGLTFDEAGAILTFVLWLENKDYIILDAKRMVRLEIKI